MRWRIIVAVAFLVPIVSAWGVASSDDRDHPAQHRRSSAGTPARPTSERPESPPLTREAVEAIVRDYLREHPEIVVDALRAAQERLREAARQRSREAIGAHIRELVADPDAPVAGSPTGDVTIVEFFDYRCAHCKRVAGAVKQLLRDDAGVRLVYKEFPILGDESHTAARAALAARAQGKYTAFHDALMAAAGSLAMADVVEIARSVGLDAARLQVDMQRPEIRAAIDRNLALGAALGVRGTPAFVIGGDIVPGAVPLEELTRLVHEARRNVPPATR